VASVTLFGDRGKFDVKVNSVTSEGKEIIYLAIMCDECDRISLHLTTENLMRIRDAITMFLGGGNEGK